MLKRILPVITVLLPFLLAAQINIKGKVIDAQTGKILPGANVSINNNYKAAITKPDGIFEIKDIKPGDYKMTVTYMGYAKWYSDLNLVESRTMLISMEQEPIMLTEQEIIESTRAGDKTPVASSTLQKDAIDQLNESWDIPFILDNLPATVSTSDAGTGIGYSSFRIRGTDMNRINITVNGIPLNDAESHNVYFVNMPDFASSVSSLQVQRGVGTSTNGSAAFGASVNLQTLTPSSDAYGEISNSVGSFNTLSHSVSAGTGLIKGKWALDTRLSKLASDGYIDRASADLKSFYLSSGYYGKNTILKFNVFSGKEITYLAYDGVPSTILDSARTYNGLGSYYDKNGNLKYYKNENDNYQQDHYQFIFAKQISNKVTTNLALHYTRGRGYYEQYRDDDKLSAYGLDPVHIFIDNKDTLMNTSDIIRQKHLDNHFYGYTMSVNYNPDNRLKMTFGSSGNIYDGDHFGNITWTEFAIDAVPDYQWYKGNGLKKDLNIYVKANHQTTKRLNLYGDLQLRAINYKITGIDDDFRDITQTHDFLFFNPKAGAFFNLHSNGSIYASIAIAHREPNRDNYTDADPSKPAPVAEELTDYELGYQYNKDKFSFTANAYYMFYTNQLILTGEINDVGSAIMTNVDKSYRTGLELMGNYKLTQSLLFNMTASFSNNKIVNFIEKVDNWDEGGQITNVLGNTDLAFSPNFISAANLVWNTKTGFNATLEGKYVSKQYVDNTSSNDRSIDPYFISNIRLSYSIKPKFVKELLFNLAFNNILDSKYETNAWVYRYYSEGRYSKMDGYFPQAGANFMAGLSIKL